MISPSRERPLQNYVIHAKAGIQRGRVNGGLPDFHSVRCPPMGFAGASRGRGDHTTITYILSIHADSLIHAKSVTKRAQVH